MGLASEPYSSPDTPVNPGKIAPHILKKAKLGSPRLWFDGEEAEDNFPEETAGGVINAPG